MLEGINASTSPSNDSNTDSRAQLSENYEMFLTLLTEQLQNQDPLSPMDSNEFTSQLVQFSEVEQSILQNENMETLISSQTANLVSATASMVGQDAAFESGDAYLADGSATWFYEPEAAAVDTRVVIRDESGRVVHEEDLGFREGRYTYEWDGRDQETQDALESGFYSASFTARNDDEETIPVSTFGVSPIEAVDYSNGVDPLLITGDRRRSVTEVVQLSGEPKAR